MTLFLKDIIVICRGKTLKGRSILFSRYVLSLLKRKGFWILLWQGIKANFGVYSVVISGNEAYSVGLSEPDKELWDTGYKVNKAGYILGKIVLIYAK